MTFASKLALLGGLASTAVAHGTVTGFTTDGTYNGGFLLDYYYMEQNGETPPDTAGWYAEDLDNGFVEPNDFGSPDIICHKNARPATSTASVAAGGVVEFQWTEWPDSHMGPVLTYVANCGGDCADTDKESLQWVKIDEAGYDADTQEWAAIALIANNNTWATTVPETLAAGNYVFRHEIIALHGAGEENGAQSYPQCVNIEVTGSGTDEPEGVLGTELYTSTDPGILFDPYSGDIDYTIPGPALYGAGSTPPTPGEPLPPVNSTDPTPPSGPTGTGAVTAPTSLPTGTGAVTAPTNLPTEPSSEPSSPLEGPSSSGSDGPVVSSPVLVDPSAPEPRDDTEGPSISDLPAFGENPSEGNAGATGGFGPTGGFGGSPTGGFGGSPTEGFGGSPTGGFGGSPSGGFGGSPSGGLGGPSPTGGAGFPGVSGIPTADLPLGPSSTGATEPSSSAGPGTGDDDQEPTEPGTGDDGQNQPPSQGGNGDDNGNGSLPEPFTPQSFIQWLQQMAGSSNARRHARDIRGI